MNAALTSVYMVIAVWIPVTVVPTSLATVAIDTFITDVSSVIRNCPDARVSRTSVAACVRGDAAVVVFVVIVENDSSRRPSLGCHPEGAKRASCGLGDAK